MALLFPWHGSFKRYLIKYILELEVYFAGLWGLGVFFGAGSDVLHCTSVESEPSASYPGHVRGVGVITL